MLRSFEKLLEIVDAHNTFVLTTHVIPDGDAIGSVLSFDSYLRQKGKDVHIINHSVTPDNLSFLDKKNRIQVFPGNEEKLKPVFENSDVIVILDTNEYSRTRSLEKFILDSPAKKLCIDHHQGVIESDYYFVLSNTEYAATCQLLYDYITFDKSEYIDIYVAECLYAGIMTDTGSFRFPRTTSTVFRVCADLIDRGVNPVELYDKINNTVSKSKLELLKRFLNSLQFEYNNSVVTSVITENDFNECKAEPNDVEGFTSYLMSIDNIKLGILIAEMPKMVKVSLRSKGNIPVNEFAKELGGGGHLNAAGISLQKSDLSAIKADLLQRAKKYLNQ